MGLARDRVVVVTGASRGVGLIAQMNDAPFVTAMYKVSSRVV